MAEIQPLRALHYNTSVVGPLDDVVAPPYDVIDAEQRARLIGRSPFNVVAVDLPQGEPDPYESARELFDRWQLQGALVRDREPALWAHTQEYNGPEDKRLTRRGFFCRVRLEGYGPGRVRPHERTHPGPKEDRLRLTRATRANISPIFSLYSDPSQRAWSALAGATESEPWGEVKDGDGTVHRIWRVSDPETIAAVQDATREAEALRRDFEISDVPLEQIAPPPGNGPLQLGYVDAHLKRPSRLTLKDQSIADAALRGHAQPYRELDTGVLEALVLKGALEHSRV